MNNVISFLDAVTQKDEFIQQDEKSSELATELIALFDKYAPHPLNPSDPATDYILWAIGWFLGSIPFLCAALSTRYGCSQYKIVATIVFALSKTTERLAQSLK